MLSLPKLAHCCPFLLATVQRTVLSGAPKGGERLSKFSSIARGPPWLDVSKFFQASGPSARLQPIVLKPVVQVVRVIPARRANLLMAVTTHELLP